MSDNTHFVYVARRADGLCLYVGCTNNVARRMAAHRRTSGWTLALSALEVTEFPTRAAALVAEARSIRALRPPNNVRGNPDRNASIETAVAS